MINNKLYIKIWIFIPNHLHDSHPKFNMKVIYNCFKLKFNEVNLIKIWNLSLSYVSCAQNIKFHFKTIVSSGKEIIEISHS
jgi:hypothetical protein